MISIILTIIIMLGIKALQGRNIYSGIQDDEWDLT
jgi:hypothetical protein